MPIGDYVDLIEGSYVIIVPDVSSYESLAGTFARWKRQLGYRAMVFTLSEIGSSAEEIKDFITEAYHSWE